MAIETSKTHTATLDSPLYMFTIEPDIRESGVYVGKVFQVKPAEDDPTNLESCGVLATLRGAESLVERLVSDVCVSLEAMGWDKAQE